MKLLQQGSSTEETKRRESVRGLAWREARPRRLRVVLSPHLLPPLARDRLYPAPHCPSLRGLSLTPHSLGTRDNAWTQGWRPPALRRQGSRRGQGLPRSRGSPAVDPGCAGDVLAGSAPPQPRPSRRMELRAARRPAPPSTHHDLGAADVGTYEKANATRAPLTTMKSRMFHRSRK